MQKENTNRKKSKILSILIIIIIILLLIGRNSCSDNSRSNVRDLSESRRLDSIARADSLQRLMEDSNRIQDSIAAYIQDSIKRFQLDSLEIFKQDSIEQFKLDSIEEVRYQDSVARVKRLNRPVKIDSTSIKDSLEKLARANSDTTAPYIYLDPPAGLYKNSVSISIRSDENNVHKFYRVGKSGTDFTEYTSSLSFKDSTLITFFGIDSIGNSTDTLSSEYHVAIEKNPCGKNMVYVKSKKVCVDTYEWPNKKSKKPSNFVSMYAAIDSCASVEKRLCTEDEWKEAAGGSKNRYPYGGSYSRRKCNTESGKRSGSGKYKECRSYYGAYDMTGNLSEWTSTEDGKNPGLYRVYGGSFSSTSTATTRSYKFSYYPTNKYVGVGFRCCTTQE